MGTNFAVNVTDLLQLTLYCPGTTATEGAYVYWQAVNLETLLGGSGTITTNLPQGTHTLTPSVWITNNATAAAVTLDFVSCYLESRW
jgi:hypothetical protein